MPEVLSIFQEPFMQTATIVGCLSILLCSWVGTFLLLRRTVFIGIALSEVAALGVAAGLFLGWNVSLTAMIFVFLVMVLFSLPLRTKQVSRDGLIGLTYVFSAALAVIFVAKNPLAEAHGINILSGNLIYSSWGDVRDLCVLTVLVTGALVLFHKEFLFVAVDRVMAKVCGLNTQFWDFLYYFLLGAVFSFTVKICGVIFVFAALVLPAMIGLLVARQMRFIFVISFVVGWISVVLGMVLSFVFDLPSSPTIIVLLSLLYFLAFFKRVLCGFFKLFIL